MNWPSCRRSVEAERREPVEATMPRLDLQLLTTTLDPLACLVAWQRQLADLPGGMPAAEAHFTGRVRGVSGQGLPLEALELEHYPAMAERRLQELAMVTAQGAAAVLVAVDRRGPAQRCGQALLEGLQHEVPFWKREWVNGVGTWLEGNTPL
ncbi:MAG: molybdenum cofactor biosynthesis protein MoaE [Cyanobacteria bacterium]|nr:molybdenum cofactor biosynthesis protein MoaE [Cyanobacteriota bacterium]